MTMTQGFKASSFLALAGALSLGACATAEYDQPFTHVADSHPITIERTERHVSLMPVAGTYQVSHGDQAELHRALAEFAEGGQGPFIVEYPRGSQNEDAARAIVAKARAFAPAYGLAPGAVRAAPYDAAGQRSAEVRLRFTDLTAKGPDCGMNWTSLTKTAMNQPHPNFGCATRANMAAMIADPNDLVRPRGLDPADTARRTTVLTSYREGQDTRTEADQGGTVSEAVE